MHKMWTPPAVRTAAHLRLQNCHHHYLDPPMSLLYPVGVQHHAALRTFSVLYNTKACKTTWEQRHWWLGIATSIQMRQKCPRPKLLFCISALFSGEEPCQFFQELVWPNRAHTTAPAPLVPRYRAWVDNGTLWQPCLKALPICIQAFKCKRKSSSVASNACFECTRRSSSVARGWIVIIPPPHPKTPPACH